MNTRNTTILTISAVAVVIGLGVLAHLDTQFQRIATDTGLALLGLLVLCGLLGALIAPLLDYWTETSADVNRADSNDRISGPQGPVNVTSTR